MTTSRLTGHVLGGCWRGWGEVLFCHGSPRSNEEIITAATPEERLRAMLVGVRKRVVVCGHRHMQFDRNIDGSAW
jgi:diadenosine tetraphosphatase ApaH/serine/threonine PP2A family protein phosphatase